MYLTARVKVFPEPALALNTVKGFVMSLFSISLAKISKIHKVFGMLAGKSDVKKH